MRRLEEDLKILRNIVNTAEVWATSSQCAGPLDLGVVPTAIAILDKLRTLLLVEVPVGGDKKVEETASVTPKKSKKSVRISFSEVLDTEMEKWELSMLGLQEPGIELMAHGYGQSSEERRPLQARLWR